MIRLGELIGRAKALVAPQRQLATDVVERQMLDTVVHRELIAEVPALRELSSSLNRRYGYTEELVRDVMLSFWQQSPAVRPKEAMAPSRLINWAVVDHIAHAPETVSARAYTTHDRYASAMATLGVADTIRTLLADSTEAQQATEQAEQDSAREAAAQQALEQALAALQGDPDASEGEGLAELVAAAETAQQRAADSLGQAQAGVGRLAQRLREPIRDAIRSASAELAKDASLTAAWGAEDGELSRLDFATRDRLAKQMRASQISSYLDLLGRFLATERALRGDRVHGVREEIVGIELSGRVQDVLPSELALAGTHRMLRLDFFRRMATGQLLTYAYAGHDNLGQGAVIAVVDSSGSMRATDVHGIARSVWARALPLALLRRARAQGRDFVGIIFSSTNQVRTFRFPRGRGSIVDVLEFATFSFNGGTSFEGPLSLATQLVRSEFNDTGKARADLVFITDDDCQVSAAWLEQHLAAKAELGFRTYGIAVGDARIGSTLAAVSDDVRSVTDFASADGVRDILAAI